MYILRSYAIYKMIQITNRPNFLYGLKRKIAKIS